MESKLTILIQGQKLKDVFVLIRWPFVQELMEYEWFRPECRLRHAFEDQEYLSSAYFVPLSRLLEVGQYMDGAEFNDYLPRNN